MKVLLTGANGYIGTRLLNQLCEGETCEVTCLVRDQRRFNIPDHTEGPWSQVDVLEGDLLAEEPPEFPEDVDVAFYLIHSMGSGKRDFHDLERKAAENFVAAVKKTRARQIIYLSGISNSEKLSRHLESRRQVEDILRESGIPTTVLRAAIIIGAGSASFEIIRDLVEKLPVMIAPKWLKTRCQPIAIRNVIGYLTEALGNEATYDRTFDIGGPDVMTYREMLDRFARVRGLNRSIFPVPVLSPRLSSYWLYFVTSTSYPLAQSLVDSMKNEVVCAENSIRDIIPLELLSYEEAVEKAFSRIEQSLVPSSWFDSLSSGKMKAGFMDRVHTPVHGVMRDVRCFNFTREPNEVQANFWRIGGSNGWYTMDWAWRLRGWMDKVVGGTGLRRGRRHPTQLHAGDALDFWRVILADSEKRRLMLYAEMKLPGEAWLEWRILENEAEEGTHELLQIATFRPAGLFGRLYWYAVLPFHHFVFQGMAEAIIQREVEVDPSSAG